MWSPKQGRLDGTDSVRLLGFQVGAYLVGACVVERFVCGECLLPGVPGCIAVACGFLGVPELEKGYPAR